MKSGRNEGDWALGGVSGQTCVLMCLAAAAGEEGGGGQEGEGGGFGDGCDVEG